MTTKSKTNPIPQKGQVWEHYSGNRFSVALVANEDAIAGTKYPMTAVLQNDSGRMWAEVDVLKAENKRLRDALEEIRNRSSMGVMRSDQSSQSELEVVLADICLFVDAVLWKED